MKNKNKIKMQNKSIDYVVSIACYDCKLTNQRLKIKINKKINKQK